VDDDPLVLELRTRTLKSQGYSTVAASDGRMALSLFDRVKPDLVVLDYDMPGMNGHEVAVQMRDRNPEVPLILLSAYITFPESVIACFDVYLTKGEDISVFLSHVDRLANRT
jgi:CheY-like chemotaxis protein